MRVLILNQTFYPDVVASAQHASVLAQRLVERGYEVTVIAGMHAYDDPNVCFPHEERWNGIRIRRIRQSNFGKGAKWRRAIDFASFYLACAWRLLWIGRSDIVIAMTSPPLISFLAAIYAKLCCGRLVPWMLDMNPDEAIAAGWLQPDSLIARLLHSSLCFSLRHSRMVVVLDRFMRERVLAKDGSANVAVVPPWTHDASVSYNDDGRRRFRREHSLENKFVVMYSGNHSPCHPLHTLLDAAKRLKSNQDIAFCFVGGGSEFATVKRFAAENGLANVTCLPYQPLNGLSASLSAADLHVVAMGNPFVGIVHPCKIYNILKLGIPFLYIGPKESHVTDIVPPEGVAWARFARHGDSDGVVSHILEAKAAGFMRYEQETMHGARFSEAAVTGKLIRSIEEYCCVF